LKKKIIKMKTNTLQTLFFCECLDHKVTL
jgi:hypothetical protein